MLFVTMSSLLKCRLGAGGNAEGVMQFFDKVDMRFTPTVVFATHAWGRLVSTW